ncbi:MAG: HPr(Ser) kinase/phosphatase [Eubacteriales bacterium]|jgi:HPr kinase/phosphorylase|nr:HPr(Ser) kinase/phosphatase [Eubacteriales bacterium]
MSEKSDIMYFVTLKEIVDRFKLEWINRPKNCSEIKISSNEVNRPGMQIAGFYDYFDANRIQILGMVEHKYLEHQSSNDRKGVFNQLFSKQIPLLVVTRDLEIFPEISETAKENSVAVCRTSLSTSEFMSALIAFLNTSLAPRITRHGVLVEVYGEGVLLLGESGVGKSEAAVELLKRGHRLVADDAVEIKKVSAISLVGSAPEIIRHFIEIRGIGIIDVKQLFGMGAVKDSEKIDLVLNLEPWVDGKHYDRLGLVNEYTNILGIEIPSLVVPVKPGRNLAIIVEVAAMNNRQKRMGYNAAEALNQRLIKGMGKSIYQE